MTDVTKRTPGPWRRGKWGGSIVADYPVCTIHGADEIEYYGGHLIAESVAPQNIDAIIRECNHFDAVVGALREVAEAFKLYDEDRGPLGEKVIAVLEAIDKESCGCDCHTGFGSHHQDHRCCGREFIKES